MQVYETQNSIYYIDDHNHLYLRRPVDEQVVESHRLEYDKWIPLREAFVRPDGSLHIFAQDSVLGIITSPVIKSYEKELNDENGIH